ncbi:MAG: globin [Sulfurovum sp.]|nr:globin [Sulfurovum sp.]
MYSEITKENLTLMVNTFYAKIIKDDIVSPFFIAKLGEDINNDHWKEHLGVIRDFWTSIAMGDRDYNGNPFLPHTKLGDLKRETFMQWLKLFSETLDEIFIPEIAKLFKERAGIIAGNFMRNLGI